MEIRQNASPNNLNVLVQIFVDNCSKSVHISLIVYLFLSIYLYPLVPIYLSIYLSACSNLSIYLSIYLSYLPTPPLGQDMTQG